MENLYSFNPNNFVSDENTTFFKFIKNTTPYKRVKLVHFGIFNFSKVIYFVKAFDLKLTWWEKLRTTMISDENTTFSKMVSVHKK
jgi:hypothetical protein